MKVVFDENVFDELTTFILILMNPYLTHLLTLRRNVPDANLDVFRDRVTKNEEFLFWTFEHLLVHARRRNAATEERRSRRTTAVPRNGSVHHVHGVAHLLQKFWNREREVLLGTTRET